jgi:hypothetical protein
LYHCAELTLSKGYEGFRILTPINLSAVQILKRPPNSNPEVLKVHSGGYVIYSYSYNEANKPSITGDIQLIHKPFTPVLAKLFDAKNLESVLHSYVKGSRCGTNVCPHIHSYIYGVPTADSHS